MLNRRQFVGTTAAAAAALTVGASVTVAGESKTVRLWEVTLRAKNGTDFIRLDADRHWKHLSRLFQTGNVLNVRLVERNHQIEL